MIVYLITNRVNDKVYVGKYAGSDPMVRWSAHVRHAQRGAKQHLSNAIRKYGASAFDVSVLEQCTTEKELNAREAHHIARLQSNKVGYNMTTGGEGFSKGNTYRVGKKLTDAHKARIAQANSKPKSPETIERMRLAQRNRAPLSQESRLKMSLAAIRRGPQPVTAETAQKISRSKKGRSLNAKQLAAVRASGIRRRGVPRPPNAAQIAYYESVRGVARPPYISVKISAALRGKPFTQEHRDSISRGKTGVRLEPMHRKSIGDAVRRTRLRNHMDHVHMWMGVTV